MKLFIALFITSCTLMNPVKYSHLQNGKKIYVTTCNGNRSNIAKCHQNASIVCQGKYEVTDTESIRTAEHTTTRYDEIHKSTTSNTTQSINRTVLFACKGSEANLELLNSSN